MRPAAACLNLVRRWRAMPRRLLAASLCLAAGLAAAFGLAGNDARPLALSVHDAQGGAPVFGARVAAGGRVALLFRGRQAQILLPPGVRHVLHASAPGYHDRYVPVEAGRTAPLAIAMTGREIPGLGGIIAWPRSEAGSLVFDVQLRSTSGANIEFFPRLPLPVQVRLYDNAGGAARPLRGELLYEGVVMERYHAGGGASKLSYAVPFSAIAARPGNAGPAIAELTLTAPNGRFTMSRADVDWSEGEGSP